MAQGRDRPRRVPFSLFAILLLTHGLTKGLRLADKRSLPCPKRNEWIAARDELYEEIMLKAWNPKLQCFGQSYEETDILDSSVLIMPLVFFIQPVSVHGLCRRIEYSINHHQSDPRFVTTLRHILKTPDRGGLTSNVN
jgi:GH15 family glucan-1,4-alpha-glucosidase